MHAECEIADPVLSAQARMFRLAERDYGLTLPVLYAETKIPTDTLRSYAGKVKSRPIAQMPIGAFVKLTAVIPDVLTSMLFATTGKAICDDEPEDHDVDDLARAAMDVLNKYIGARHPESAGGIRIVHSEIPDIQRSAKALKAAAKKVAA